MVGSFISSAIAYIVVGVILLHDSPLLGLLVLVGVPAFSGLLFLLVRPMRARQSAYCDAIGEMNTVATDSVRGLRVLRGIGGGGGLLSPSTGSGRPDARAAGVRVAWPLRRDRVTEGAGQRRARGRPDLGQRRARSSAARSAVGELVAFYGYAGFMVMPVSLIAQVVSFSVQATVGARRIVGLLAIPPLVADEPQDAVPDPAAPVASDAASGTTVQRNGHLGILPPVGASTDRRPSRATGP